MSSGPDNYESQKRMIAEQIWLKYYNQVLFEKGMITEEEHNRMINRINARNGMIGLKGNPSISC